MNLLNKTIKQNLSSAFLAVLAILAAFSLFCVSFAAAAPFNDVPKDHWAYEAIEKLVQNGYMDGFADDTFRGRKVLTRYEIALTLAKILTKVEDVESSGGVISPKDAEVIKSLATEFREELNTLGAKVNNLDQRVTELEKFKKNVEKLKWAGYYRATNVAVWDRLTTKNDGDNYDDDFDEGDANGLGKLRNQVNLKLTGKPFDNVETYTEIKAFINSAKGPSKSYIYKSDNTIRPYLEKYMSDFSNDRDLIMEKMHLKIDSQYANVRAFNNESITKLNDPVILLNSYGKNMFNQHSSDTFSGIETRGTIKDVTYNVSALKEWNNTSDIYAGRMVYMVPERILKTTTAEIIFGTSFVEKANDYTKRGNFSQVNGVDLSFKFTDIGTLKVMTEYMESRNGESVLYGGSSTEILKDDGVKLDLEYQLENLVMILNHYRYGKDFAVATARYDTLYMDTDYDGSTHNNYGRKSIFGERFSRLTLKYNIPFTDEQALRLEGIIQNKKWEHNEKKPHETDGYEAQKFSFQVDADLAKDMTSKFFTELAKDAFKDEVGKTYTEIELNAKLNERIASTARFSNAQDMDYINKESKSYKENSFYGELSSQLLKNIWGKVFGERRIKHIGWHDANTVDPSIDNTEKLIDQTGFETNFTLTPSLTLKLTTASQHNVYNAYTLQNEKFNWFTTELTEVFTDKLKGRILYWWKNPQNHEGKSNDNLRNLVAEIAYDPTDKTRMRVRYGDFIDSDQNWKDIETEKKLSFEASTDF
jgi:hypothetical protein